MPSSADRPSRRPSSDIAILSEVKASYIEELGALPAAYASGLGVDAEAVGAATYDLRRGPAIFVGSGGTMVLAQLAARLHEAVARQCARPCTALEAVDLPQVDQRGALLFSSSGKHPDARRMLADFRRGRYRPAIVMTHGTIEDLDKTAGPDTRIVRLPAVAEPDGFLATGSVLQMAVVLLRSYLESPALTGKIEAATFEERPLREEVLVLTPPALAPVACDIEVRLVESGLAAVQVADYRNFAHGRHTGFARRLDAVTVIALSDVESEPLASGTLAALPSRVDVRRWHGEGRWPAALLSLLIRSMCLVGSEGERAGLDVARPKVPTFGRRLYRLPLGKRVAVQRAGGVERKILALGAGDSEELRTTYRAAADDWRARLGEQRFGALVADYDGTVCWTSRRRELLEHAVREQLHRLLDEGMVVGFASGRGQSLHTDLRRWLPQSLWSRVVLGLYNGAVLARLDEALGDLRTTSSWSSAVVAALKELPFRSNVEIEERGAQVTIGVVKGAFADGRLDQLVRDQLWTAGVAAQVVASGHSLDVVSPFTRKTSVIEAVREFCDGEVLSVGDQGQPGGNDHALLAHSEFSLTVDRCSADPSRCWYAGSGEHVGPGLFVRYLKALRSRQEGFAFKGGPVL